MEPQVRSQLRPGSDGPGASSPGRPRSSPDGLQQLAWPLGLLTGHLRQVQHSQAQALSLLLQAEAHWEAPTHQVTAVLRSGTGGQPGEVLHSPTWEVVALGSPSLG